MADTSSVRLTSFAAGTKRGRDEDDDGGEMVQFAPGVRSEKKARPSTGDSSSSWPQQDSVLSTPTAHLSQYTFQKRPYDSDEHSSMISEPGSPQDIAMSTDDEDMTDDIALYSHPLSDGPSSASTSANSNTWRARLFQNRVPTPIQMPPRPGAYPLQHRRDSIRSHVRQRHPQENVSMSSDHLEVPSPIDEDEVPTPPSAAEAAGSQLSMLTVNDMDIEPPADARLPSISIDTAEVLQFPDGDEHTMYHMDSAIADDSNMESGTDERESRLIVRRQRQRSGALSGGQGSPVRPQPPSKRGLSLGYRADCEKCRLRVPGHFNHFVS